MLQRYNIALLPQHKTQDFIALADRLSADACTYKLSRQSLPHVTLCQFRARSDELPAIWESLIAHYPSFETKLVFEGVSLFYGSDVNWISLVPDQALLLQTMHRAVLKKIKQPLGRIRASFDPHLTLCNVAKTVYLPGLSALVKPMLPLQDSFILSLGVSDELGQYIERVDAIF